MPTTFFLMRHGLTDWNQKKQIQGQTDIDLCQAGRDMARKWGKGLQRGSFDHIVYSPLSRTHHTAKLVNLFHAVPMTEDARLKELDWGDWTAMTPRGAEALSVHIQAEESKGWNFCPPNGESRLQLLERVKESLCAISEDHPDKRVLIVTHNGVLMALAHWMHKMQYLPNEKKPLRPYHYHKISYSEQGFRSEEWNREFPWIL